MMIEMYFLHKKIDALEKFLSVATSWKFQKYFEDSFLLQFYWEENFLLEERPSFKVEKKITFFLLIKKYFSKKIRDLISSIKNFSVKLKPFNWIVSFRIILLIRIDIKTITIVPVMTGNKIKSKDKSIDKATKGFEAAGGCKFLSTPLKLQQLQQINLENKMKAQ